MKKSLKKLLLFLISAVVCVFVLTIQVNATGSAIVNNFTGGKGDNSQLQGLATSSIKPVLTVVRVVAIGISMIMITYLGIKYMSAAPSEKATIKNQLIAFVVGVSLIVTATTVLDIIKSASQNATNV